MSKKSILYTFLGALAVFFLITAFAAAVYYSRPSADSFAATVPLPPKWAPEATPPTPAEPIVLGDSTDDGIVNSMDINALLARWKTVDADYDIASSGDKNLINGEDLTQIFKYWHCQELLTDKDCPYKTD